MKIRTAVLIGVICAACFIGLCVIVLAIYGVSSVIRGDRLMQQRREQRIASVNGYVDDVTEKRAGDPPQYLFHVEYRILKPPYPTAAKMEESIGKADSTENVSGETRLEWLGNPSSDPVLLRATFDEAGLLKELDYVYGHETIGRSPLDWKREIEIKAPAR